MATYVYINQKTGKKETSNRPLLSKEYKLIRQVGQVVTK